MKQKHNENILKTMFSEMEKAPHVFHPSKFWVKLNRLHIGHLSKTGFLNFKRTINYHYFSWGILSIIRHQLSPVINELVRGNLSPIFDSSFNDNTPKSVKNLRRFNPLASAIYRIYVSSLMECVSKIDGLNILKKLKEPKLGNPFLVTYKGKPVSQDICNSVYEFYSITKKLTLPKNLKIAELGAGYGRLGYVFLNVIPDCSYCIIDIPPALYMSETYLKKVFPKEKIFSFRPFSSYREIKSEFESSRIRLIMPHQLELLPEKYFDLFINISSLHEMKTNQIKKYILMINKSCKGYFYTKQWLKSQTKDNFNIRENQYPIPKNWKIISRNSPHPIQKMFFDALYKV